MVCSLYCDAKPSRIDRDGTHRRSSGVPAGHECSGRHRSCPASSGLGNDHPSLVRRICSSKNRHHSAASRSSHRCRVAHRITITMPPIAKSQLSNSHSRVQTVISRAYGFRPVRASFRSCHPAAQSKRRRTRLIRRTRSKCLGGWRAFAHALAWVLTLSILNLVVITNTTASR